MLNFTRDKIIYAAVHDHRILGSLHPGGLAGADQLRRHAALGETVDQLRSSASPLIGSEGRRRFSDVFDVADRTATELVTARSGVATVVAPAPNGELYVYVAGGTGAAGALDTYEVASLSADGQTLGTFVEGTETFGDSSTCANAEAKVDRAHDDDDLPDDPVKPTIQDNSDANYFKDQHAEFSVTELMYVRSHDLKWGQ